MLRPIETAPKDGRYILLFGDSGYTTTPLRCQVCRYDAEYRPLQPWITFSNDSFLDDGGPPTHWMPLPELCSQCNGTGSVDSGGVTPWGYGIDVPCPMCSSIKDEQ